MNLDSSYVLFSQCTSCDNTQDNGFFQISSHSRAYVSIICEKTIEQIRLRPSLGKQNIQANTVHPILNLRQSL